MFSRKMNLSIDTTDLDELVRKMQKIVYDLNEYQNQQKIALEMTTQELSNMLSIFENQFKKEIRKIIREEIRNAKA